MKKIFFLSLFFSSCCGYSQSEKDSTKTLDEVMVRSFGQDRRLSSAVTSVKIIELNNGDRYNKTSLVNGFNTLAGVRMEERSPGSYRINIRGSSIRSPFGVRNVKVYWNDIPITDPGGNTYFNQFAWNNFSYIEISKGPAGSMYGAGTGGLILLNNSERPTPAASLEYITGSYGLQNIFASARWGKDENKNQLTYAHNQTNGYRTQTKMRRDNLSWRSSIKISGKQQLTASLLFTDMYYQTPGALTIAEFMADPKQARPAGGGFPSAVNAHAAIFQKNITTGFTHIYQFNSSLKNSTTVYGTFSQIKNPAIRNYERRMEPSFGGRTVFTCLKKAGATGPGENIFQVTGGSEFQKGYFNTRVAKNKNGNPDTLQTDDDIDYTTYNIFLQGDGSIKDKWFFNAGVSLNKTKVAFKRLNTYPVTEQERKYRNELAPRVSLKGKITDYLILKTTVSRGFSPPTIAELLPSTGIISTGLEAEYGWNYEMTISQDLFKRNLRIEITGFYFKLNKALVQRRDISGADYFVNAGDIRQKGLESQIDYSKNFTAKSFVDYFRVVAAHTYDHFRYGNFVKGTEDFSGKTVPSVPTSTFSLLADIYLNNGVYSNTTWYSASEIFLNDANTATAAPYHLLGWRIGWKKTFRKKYKLDLYTGADNMLNEHYSLGNDINAAANRFYNAAPGRNYYAGLSFQWIRPVKN